MSSSLLCCMLLSCKAPDMFCRLRGFTQLSISMGGEWTKTELSFSCGSFVLSFSQQPGNWFYTNVTKYSYLQAYKVESLVLYTRILLNFRPHRLPDLQEADFVVFC